jgi:hypothetical protein
LNKGWECPKCGNVYSPIWFECQKCNKKTASDTAELAATDSQQLKESIVLIRAAAHKYLTGLYEFNQFESHLEAIEQRASV